MTGIICVLGGFFVGRITGEAIHDVAKRWRRDRAFCSREVFMAVVSIVAGVALFASAIGELAG